MTPFPHKGGDGGGDGGGNGGGLGGGDGGGDGGGNGGGGGGDGGGDGGGGGEGGGGGDGGGAKATKFVSVGGTISSTFVKPSSVSFVLISVIFSGSVVTKDSLTVSVSSKNVNSTLNFTATLLLVAAKVFLLLRLVPCSTASTSMIKIAPGETFKTDAIALINIVCCSCRKSSTE